MATAEELFGYMPGQADPREIGEDAAAEAEYRAVLPMTQALAERLARGRALG